MESRADEFEILEQRENFYRFLGRVYRTEVDQGMWEGLTKMAFPEETGDPDLDLGYRMLAGYLKNPGEDPLTDLAVDYARIFLAAGVYEGIAAVPFESVYTSKDHLIMQDAWEEIVKLYGEKGMGPKEKDLPEDQLGLELEFVAKMIGEARAALEKGDRAGYEKSLKEQLAFVSKHLAWVPALCEDVQKCPGTDFYKGAAYLTKGFVRIDRELLEELLSEKEA